MKRKRKIVFSIVLIILLVVFYMGYTLYRNITDIDDLKSELIDCTNSSQSGFTWQEDCLYNNLVECVPATNYNGFNILGWRKDKCKVIIQTNDGEGVFCYFEKETLNELKSIETFDTAETLASFILDKKESEECKEVGYSAIFLRRFWN